MVDFGRISAVRQRISEIQQQFGFPSKVPGMDFSQALQREMDKGEVKAANPSAAPVEATNAAARTAPQGSSRAESTPAAEASSLSAMMDQAARKYNVDSRLIAAVAEVESDKDQSAVSSAGAVGVMQLMPETAAALGVDPYDTRQNIEGGAKYLRQMLDSFGGDVRKALAAYNAGPQAVRDYNGVPPYRETQNYVNKVLDIYR